MREPGALSQREEERERGGGETERGREGEAERDPLGNGHKNGIESLAGQKKERKRAAK